MFLHFLVNFFKKIKEVASFDYSFHLFQWLCLIFRLESDDEKFDNMYMEYSERDILQRIVNFQLYYFEKKNLKGDNSVTFLYRIAQYELRHIKLDGVRTPSPRRK